MIFLMGNADATRAIFKMLSCPLALPLPVCHSLSHTHTKQSFCGDACEGFIWSPSMHLRLVQEIERKLDHTNNIYTQITHRYLMNPHTAKPDNRSPKMHSAWLADPA